jgi:hypothetical protein
MLALPGRPLAARSAMPRYTAVLDARVLVPIALADTLLRVAENGLYRPLWSDRILGEAQTAIEEIHPCQVSVGPLLRCDRPVGIR